MTTVLTLLTLVFLFGIPIFLVRLLLDIIKKRPKKKDGFGILICCVLSIGCLMNFVDVENEAENIPVQENQVLALENKTDSSPSAVSEVTPSVANTPQSKDVSTVSPKTESEKTGIEESLPDTLAETKEKISNEMKALLPEDVVNNERFDLWINLYDTDIYQIFLKINLQTDDIEECKKTSIEYFEALSKLEYTVETYFFTFLNDGDTICDISKSNGDNDFYFSIDNKEPVLMELKSVKDEIKNDDSTSIPTEQSADLNEPESTSPTKDQSNSKQVEEAAPSTANQSNYEQVERVAIEEENKIESVQYVWVTATGSKYHSQPNCGRTKHASEITLEQAKARGLEACQKCAGWL